MCITAIKRKRDVLEKNHQHKIDVKKRKLEKNRQDSLSGVNFKTKQFLKFCNKNFTSYYKNKNFNIAGNVFSFFIILYKLFILSFYKKNHFLIIFYKYYFLLTTIYCL